MIMDDATFTSDTAAMNLSSLLEQVAIISSLLRKESSVNDDAAATARNRNVVEGRAREGMRLINDQMAAVSTELLLTVMSDLMLLHLLDWLGLEEGQAVPSSDAASDQQLMLMDAVTSEKQKKRAVAAAAKKKRYKRNKAAAKNKNNKKKTKLMSWMGGGLVPLIMMFTFGSIATFVLPLSLIHQSDGSGEGKAPPALPPSASKSLRQKQKDLRSNNNNAASVSPDVPLAAGVPPPIFSPSAVTVSNRRMKSDEDATFHPIERSALSAFYDSAKGADWTDRTNWLDEHTNTSYCYWRGVTCDEMGHVAKLNLTNNGLSGRLSESIGNLTFIEVLDLSDNDIKGSIPTDIGLPNLRQFDMSSNSLSGELPGLEGSRASLKILNLAHNKLEGTIPPSIGNMALLEVFDVSDNLLRSTIPSELGKLVGTLNRLDLANNTLSGAIPSQLGQLKGASVLLEGNLFDFDLLERNLFDNKTAPLSLCLGREVKEFDLANDTTLCPVERNALSDFYDSVNGTEWTDRSLWLDEYASYCDWKGVMCEENRVRLNLTKNGLSGRLSKRIGIDLAFIAVLDLSHNDIKGSIPTEIGLLSKLTYLRLSYNALTGSIPEEMGRFQFLEIMNLAGNKLTGSIPDDLGRFQSLKRLNLAGNELTGSIPDDLGRFSLQRLILADNELTGSIPEDLGKFQSLKMMKLAGNKLSRSIPPTIGDMTVLEVLELSSNVLSGQIPFQIGQLEGTLKHLDLSNNTLSGTIPSQIGRLQGASVLLKDNLFDNKTAPLSLCMLYRVGVEAFDLANIKTFCPVERNALSDFYDSAKGAEWTDRTNWLDGDDYTSYCKWKGVTCDDMYHVTELNLANNGLSGRLSESIGNLTFIEVLDLSDNDIKGSIPTQIGLLSNLTYLRLSYNAFTGAAPEGLGELKQLQLLQLQTNRITKIPNIPQLDESIYNKSTLVTDCGVPTAFDKALECEHCTMCCNANEDCYPQEETQIAEHLDLNYSEFAALLIACFVAFCCMVALSLYLFSKRKNRGNALTTSTERRLEEDGKYALSRIGKASVYSYFVTDKVLGWVVGFSTLGIQVGILVFFVVASEANLQDDAIDIQFTWKCPRDLDVCKNTADLAGAGWFIFSVLMIANLAKDMISGSKLIYHSSKVRHSLGSRIRYFIGGTLLCSITLFALYVSTIYNKAIATSNTDIIVNSVVVLFVMDLDEWIFAALEACKEKWTEHAAESEDSRSDSEAEKGGALDEMEDKITLQEAQITDQQKELIRQKIQIEQMARQLAELTELQEGVQKMQESQAAASASFETIFYCTPNASHADAVELELEDAQLDADTDAREGGTMNGTKMRNHYRKIKSGIRRGRPSKLNASSSSGYTGL